jgi:hypothetical protein
MRVSVGIVFILLLGSSTFLSGEELSGRILLLSGKVFVERGGKRVPLKPNDPLYTGDRVVTEEGTVKILLRDNSLLTLGEKTTLEINEFLLEEGKKRSGWFKVLKGKIKALMGKFFQVESNLRFETPTAVAGVRGTHFRIDVEEGGSSTFTVFEGELTVNPTRGGEFSLSTGMQFITTLEGIVQPPTTLSPERLKELEMEGEKTFQNVVLTQTASLSETIERVKSQIQPPAPSPETKGKGQEPSPSEETVLPPRIEPIPPTNLQSVDPAFTRNVKVKVTFPEVP